MPTITIGPVLGEAELPADLVDQVGDVVADPAGAVGAQVREVLADLGGVDAGGLGERLGGDRDRALRGHLHQRPEVDAAGGRRWPRGSTDPSRARRTACSCDGDPSRSDPGIHKCTSAPASSSLSAHRSAGEPRRRRPVTSKASSPSTSTTGIRIPYSSSSSSSASMSTSVELERASRSRCDQDRLSGHVAEMTPRREYRTTCDRCMRAMVASGAKKAWRGERPARTCELHRRLSAGDRGRFDELYRRYSPAAYGLALRVTGQRLLAQDVVHDAFLALWRAPEAFDPARGPFRSFFLSLVHHRAVDTIRREERIAGPSATGLRTSSPPTGEDLSERVVDDDLVARRRSEVRDALADLSAEQRQVLEMAYFAGKTQVRIAEELGIPLGTVKTRTFAALRKLRRALETED